MLYDERCPECHAEQRPELVYVRPLMLTKRCGVCGHKWHEARTAPPVERKGFITIS